MCPVLSTPSIKHNPVAVDGQSQDCIENPDIIQSSRAGCGEDLIEERRGRKRIGAEGDSAYHDLVPLFETELERVLERLDDHTHTLRREREPIHDRNHIPIHIHHRKQRTSIHHLTRSCMKCVDGRTKPRIFGGDPPSFYKRHRDITPFH